MPPISTIRTIKAASLFAERQHWASVGIPSYKTVDQVLPRRGETLPLPFDEPVLIEKK
jgi:hypothetical protein